MTNLVMSPEKRQRVWEWPAVTNLTLGGAGAGLFLLNAILCIINNQWKQNTNIISVSFLSITLVAIGFISLTIEAGKPLRGYRLFRKLSRSWMSIESLVGAAFLLFSMASIWYSASIFTFFAALVAIIFITSQGMMLYRAVGVSGWYRRVVPCFFVSCGLTTAVGFSMLFNRQFLIVDKFSNFLLFLIILTNLVIWIYLLLGKDLTESNRGLNFLRHPVLIFLIVIIGHIIPLLYLGFLFFFVSSNGVIISFLGFFIGLILIACCFLQKVGIVSATGFIRPISLSIENASMFEHTNFMDK